MSSMKTIKPHVVMLPFPLQGHVMVMMRLAKLLHSSGFYVTFVNTEFIHKLLIQSKGPDSVKGLIDFRFETIPDGLPPPDEDATSQDIASLCYSVKNTCLEPFKELLSKRNSTLNIPKVTCIVTDGLMTFGIRAARDLGIPEAVFWSPSVCSFVAALHFPELLARGIWPFKNNDYLIDGTLNTPVDWMTGMIDSVCLKDLPSFVRTTDPNDTIFHFLKNEVQTCLTSSAIIFNTFYDLDKEGLDALVSNFNYLSIYTIGPLSLLGRHFPLKKADSLNSSLWTPDSKVFEWLDSKEPKSVMYVNYGSVTTMTSQQFQEFAWGLAKSKMHFLWIIRPDLLKGESTMLPKEFIEETKDRGMLASWCEQDRVLVHKAVGAFLTHCGWNSTMESLGGGLPFICWPFFADQQTSCHYLCTKWGIGSEINHDVKREEVAELVREVMEGEKGKMMRLNAQKWKSSAEAATDLGGSSYIHFDKLVKEVLYFNN